MTFNIDNTVVTENDKTPKLKANEIHKVSLVEVKKDELKSKDNTTYKIIYLKFANEEGAIYEHKFFEPLSNEDKSNGQFGEQPSDRTQFRYTVQHLIEAINPTLFEEIRAGKKFQIKNWEDMRTFVVNNLTPGLNNSLALKLIADNKGYPTMPKYPVGLSKEGNFYMKSRFVASAEVHETKPILFTDKEKKTIETQNKANMAKPSNMKDVDFEKGGGVKQDTKEFDI